MTNRISQPLKNSLWLVFGLWLIVLQFITLSHAAEHALEHNDSHCIYSNVYHEHNAGPTTVIMPPICQQQAESIAPPVYLQPSLPWLRNLNVRAPPF
ncbi:hypothetical protein [Shewanella violacea]|uniref:DUF2607 family protein n=1 Tax=Shewanella violacea (strain JCM 10179 / CIP 106290 / LMG 19151 / DSS12) TaxID=637905 RepID=D4ZKI0_SHEVD|nr:hypothetical protein [Shewanella violacea]BAJ02179.1 hypothetical protein SVI_2208 [Shewanella violacea DSS12]